MRYKISHEPLYFFEILRIIANIVSGTSISQQLDIIAQNHGAQAMQEVQPFFQDAIALEQTFKEELPLSDAKFLFQKREHTPAYAELFFAHNQLKEYGPDNKRLAVLAFALDETFYAKKWYENPPTLTTDGELLEILDAHISDAAYKLDLMKLLHNFDTHDAYVRGFVAHGTRIIKQALPKFERQIKSCMSHIKSRLDKQGATFFMENLRIAMPDDIPFVLCPSLYAVNSYTVVATTDKDLHIISGLHYFEVMEKLRSRVQFVDVNTKLFLKCIANPTKLSIMQLIKRKPMYGAQLAKELDLTTATISHHASDLLRLGVIFITQENNRLYYHLDLECVRGHLANVSGLFG